MFFFIVLKLNSKKFNLSNKFFQIFILLFLSFGYFNSKINSNENILYNELEINHSNNLKGEQGSGGLPTNPFELVEMIRRANSMNDATKPSDAIDDAIKSFDMINNKESL